MFIYKITNLINQKIYIGKTQKSIDKRFKRHIQDAISNRLDTHLSRAIRKYGQNNFIIEEIDRASNEDELNQKEKEWILYYDSCNIGYNQTDGSDGGNTYKYKTSEELKNIKQKIKKTKIGAKNPHSKAVKCKNINTLEEYHFDCLANCKKFFSEKHHSFITKRLTNKIKLLYKGEWLFAYEDDDYSDNYTTKIINYRSKKIRVIDMENNDEERIFDSYSEAKKFYQVSYKLYSKKEHKINETFYIHNRFKITVIG